MDCKYSVPKSPNTKHRRRLALFHECTDGITFTHAFAEAVAIGQGGIWLKLTEEQVRLIRRQS